MEPDELLKLINSLDVTELREVLFTDLTGQHKDLDLLRHFSGSSDIVRLEPTDTIRRLITYVLVDYEKTHRQQKEIADSLDESLLLTLTTNDAIVADVLLQAGANMFALTVNEEGIKMTIYDRIMGSSNSCIKDLVDKYFPGIWSAVETENIEELRRLVNNWCSTDIFRGSDHLIDVALRGGHEPIIRLVSGVFWTMKLIRAVLAGNVRAVKELVTTQLKELNLDFRNMSEEGAPILYFTIKRNDIEITRLLVEAGAKLFTLFRLREDTSVEIPVFFSAIIDSELAPPMLEALLPKDYPKQDELLYRMLYRGRTCLEIAIEKDLNTRAFEILVDRCGAKLLADRNERCLTARDIASESGKTHYVRIIDFYIENCVQNPLSHPYQRQVLAVAGYDFAQISFQNPPVDNFLSLVCDYQSQVKRLGKAIEDDDTEAFNSLAHWRPKYLPDAGLFESLLVWDGREGAENPLPLLHRAVIFNRAEIVKTILALKPPGQSIDTLFDNQRRTALHYAYALRDLSVIRQMLREYGCSEHSLDRNGREPLDFKERADFVNMQKLINRLRFAEFAEEEPNAWENTSEDEFDSDDSENDNSDADEKDDKDSFGCLIS